MRASIGRHAAEDVILGRALGDDEPERGTQRVSRWVMPSGT